MKHENFIPCYKQILELKILTLFNLAWTPTDEVVGYKKYFYLSKINSKQKNIGVTGVSNRFKSICRS